MCLLTEPIFFILKNILDGALGGYERADKKPRRLLDGTVKHN